MDAYAIFEIASRYVEEYKFIGYWAVALGAFLEAIPFSGLLIPGNIMLVMAGILSYEGYLDAAAIVALAIAGAVLGDLAAYIIGLAYNGKQKLEDVERKDVFPLKRKYLEKADRFCRKHGGKGIFFGRFIGPIRPFVAFIAGVGRMPFAPFMLYNTASAILWALGFFLLGYFVEGSLKMISRIEHIVIFGLAIITVLYLIKRLFKKETAELQK